LDFRYCLKVDIAERWRLVSRPRWVFPLETYVRKIADLFLFVGARPRNATRSANDTYRIRIRLYCFRRYGGNFLSIQSTLSSVRRSPRAPPISQGRVDSCSNIRGGS